MKGAGLGDEDGDSYGVGRITVQYPACLYSIATVPTDIPHSLL